MILTPFNIFLQDFGCSYDLAEWSVTSPWAKDGGKISINQIFYRYTLHLPTAGAFFTGGVGSDIISRSCILLYALSNELLTTEIIMLLKQITWVDDEQAAHSFSLFL